MKRAIVLLALLSAGCGGTRESERTLDAAKDRQQIELAGQRIWSAVGRNDAAGIVAEYADDAILFPPNAPMVEGKAAVTTFLTDLLGAVTFRDVVGTIADVRVSGDLAIETGHYAWALAPVGGEPTPDKGKYVHVWGRTGDGTWKVIRYFSNSDVPVPAPAP